MVSKGKISENLFKKFCTQNNIFCIRLHDGVWAKEQISDYLVVLKEKYIWCEVKEVESNDYYPFSRTTQEISLNMIKRINNYTDAYIIINFKKHKKVVCLTIDEYKMLKIGPSLKLDNVPSKYIFTWLTLITKFN